MKISRNKTKLTATIALALLMSSVTLMAMPAKTVKAQYTNIQEGASIPLPAGVTPDLTVDTTAYLSFRPNPIGLGQLLLVNMWLTPPISVTRYFIGYTVTITKPDNTKVTIGPIDSYRGSAAAWFEYTVDQVGTWKLKFDMPGGYFPPGNYTVYAGAFMGPQVISFTTSCYYKPSSTAEQTLTVQQEQVLSWPPSPLPTDYWTRPASLGNREWWPILGNYPGTGVVGGGTGWPADTNAYMSNYKFTPYVQAPNTAHIVWRRQGAIAGLIGGSLGQISYEAGGGNPTIVYAGRCYQTLTKVVNGVPTSVWQCYDLRTGEVYWERTGVTPVPTLIDYGGVTRQGVPGAIGSGWTASLMYIGGGRMIKYSPWTGEVTLNFSISPLTTGTKYDGSYWLSVQNIGTTAKPNYRLINWTFVETFFATGVYTYSLNVMNNITWPWSSLPATTDFESGIAVNVVRSTSTITGAYNATNIMAASLKTGALLWNITLDYALYSGSCTVADHGKVAVLPLHGCWEAYDLYSGKLAWKSEVMDYPWDAGSFGAYDVQSAYGLFYRQAYSGIYAFNWTNGKIVWKYEAPSVPFEGTYAGYYSWDAGATIADGKMYAQNTEHGSTEPIIRGWKIHCINATTGEGIWNITGEMSPGAIADGYLTASNNFDGYMYVFGKGKSATTVTATDVVIPMGTGVVIKGTVLDMSPAQPSTPCVSKDSMTTQMEYLHQQRPIGGLWNNETITGVPVTLTAVGSDGTVIDIGTTTTNGYGGTFGMAWTPPKEDTYTIMASFAGDDSYGSSMATTAVSVGPAPAETPTPTPPEAPIDNTPLLYGIMAAVIIAIIVGIAAILLALRKRT